MNNNIVVPERMSWPIMPYAPGSERREARSYSAASILDFATFVRILQHWRWMILGAVAIGLALGIIATLLTTAVYRSYVTLEVNPPSVPVTDEQSKEMQTYQDPYDIVATQVGLLTSKTVAERTAQ